MLIIHSGVRGKNKLCSLSFMQKLDVKLLFALANQGVKIPPEWLVYGSFPQKSEMYNAYHIVKILP